MKKKVIHFKGNEKKESMEECHNIPLNNASGVIERYWFDIIKDVFNYERERGAILQEVHKLITDDRVLEGLKLYKEGKVKEGAITDVDVRAVVEGKKRNYIVALKNWKPEKLLRYRYEMEKYIADMFMDCTCEDHILGGHYRNNSSMCCKHISAVLWKLMEENNMPKFFVTPKEKEEDWYEKSKSMDLVKELYGVSMKQFQQYLNVLVLRDFKGIPTSLALSIHREPNKGYENLYPQGIKPVWLTLIEPGDVEKLIQGIIKGYVEVLASRGNTEKEIKKSVKEIFPFKKDEDLLQNRISSLEAENIKLNEKILLLEKKQIKKTLFQKIKDFFKK